MANTSDKLDKVDVAEEGIDEILSNIKDVITSASAPDSVLVLTEQVEEELEASSANDKTPQAKAPESTIAAAAQKLPNKPDILDQLDAGTTKPAKHMQVFPNEEKEAVVFSKDMPKQPVSAPTHSAASEKETLVRDDVALATQAAISQMLNPSETSETPTLSPTPLLASKSFEDVAIAMLRAELQSWLNDNLEGMVKAIVESEIKRIMPK